MPGKPPFGTWLRAKRLGVTPHLSQRALAAKIGTTNETVSRWESGKMVASQDAFFLPLAKALGLDEDEVRVMAGHPPEKLLSWLRDDWTRLEQIRRVMLKAGQESW